MYPTLVVTAQLGAGLNLPYSVMCVSPPLLTTLAMGGHSVGLLGLMMDINHC